MCDDTPIVGSSHRSKKLTAEFVGFLEAPCAMCNYNGERYWQAGSHHENCPWHHVAGRHLREKFLPNIVRTALQSHFDLAKKND